MLWFRALYDALEAFKGDELTPSVLEPFIAEAVETLRTSWPLRTFDPTVTLDDETSWNWYALSRVHEWLILDAQRDVPVASAHYASGLHVFRSARVQPAYVRALFSKLGFSAIVQPDYHPFFHEIVAIEEDETVERPLVTRTWWDGWMWGEMLFARAGVTVRCRPGTFNVRLAVASPMYFAFTRLRRQANDLSHGWGHNSQWRTGFRRDYATNAAYRYNVDGRWSIVAGEPADAEDRGVLNGLSDDTRIELLRHRSLVRTFHAEPMELWPFDDRYEEPRCGAPSP